MSNKKKQQKTNEVDVYAVTQVLIQSVAQVLGLPSFAVNIALMQLKNMPKDKLKQTLKQIFQTLEPYKEELEDD